MGGNRPGGVILGQVTMTPRFPPARVFSWSSLVSASVEVTAPAAEYSYVIGSASARIGRRALRPRRCARVVIVCMGAIRVVAVGLLI